MIDACFLELIISFSNFSLRRRNGTRPEKSDVKVGKTGNGINHVCKMKYPCTR